MEITAHCYWVQSSTTVAPSEASCVRDEGVSEECVCVCAHSAGDLTKPYSRVTC